MCHINQHSINSSKVYCKFMNCYFLTPFVLGINSSKVYCKLVKFIYDRDMAIVLIVAKCIVN